MIGLFRKNSKQQEAVKYFCKKLSSIDFWESPKFTSEKSYADSITNTVSNSTHLFIVFKKISLKFQLGLSP